MPSFTSDIAWGKAEIDETKFRRIVVRPSAGWFDKAPKKPVRGDYDRR
jgi:hypothetical protein